MKVFPHEWRFCMSAWQKPLLSHRKNICKMECRSIKIKMNSMNQVFPDFKWLSFWKSLGGGFDLLLQKLVVWYLICAHESVSFDIWLMVCAGFRCQALGWCLVCLWCRDARFRKIHVSRQTFWRRAASLSTQTPKVDGFYCAELFLLLVNLIMRLNMTKTFWHFGSS